MIADEVNYCPRCAAKLVEVLRFGKPRPTCPRCNWIFFPDPKVAAAVLIEQAGRVLLVRRAVNPQKGLWTLPAGFIDAGEDPARAAQRECLEETGLNVQVTGLLDVLAGQEHTRGANIIIFYWAEIITGELNPGDDVDRAGFFSIHDLPPLAFTTTKQILSRIDKLQ
jgi:ADP-ribose pyrophosphatase YjhB (NUDIX family)